MASVTIRPVFVALYGALPHGWKERGRDLLFTILLLVFLWLMRSKQLSDELWLLAAGLVALWCVYCFRLAIELGSGNYPVRLRKWLTSLSLASAIAACIVVSRLGVESTIQDRVSTAVDEWKAEQVLPSINELSQQVRICENDLEKCQVGLGSFKFFEGEGFIYSAFAISPEPESRLVLGKCPSPPCVIFDIAKMDSIEWQGRQVVGLGLTNQSTK